MRHVIGSLCHLDIAIAVIILIIIIIEGLSLLQSIPPTTANKLWQDAR